MAHPDRSPFGPELMAEARLSAPSPHLPAARASATKNRTFFHPT